MNVLYINLQMGTSVNCLIQRGASISRQHARDMGEATDASL